MQQKHWAKQGLVAQSKTLLKKGSSGTGYILKQCMDKLWDIYIYNISVSCSEIKSYCWAKQIQGKIYYLST